MLENSVKFEAPYEALFLLPEAICKFCGTKIPPLDSEDPPTCLNCGKIFHWSILEKIIRTIIIYYVSKEEKKQQTKRILDEFNSKRWCKKHGFTKVLELEHGNRRSTKDFGWSNYFTFKKFFNESLARI
jgi:hypothetical protein